MYNQKLTGPESKMYIKTYKMVEILKYWFSNYNSRVQAAIVKFMLNFETDKVIKDRFNIDDKMLNLLKMSYQNYCLINLDLEHKEIQLIDIPSFKIERHSTIED